MPSEEPISLRLKRGEEDRILAGHLWAFSNELQEVPRAAEAGLPAVLHAASGRPLGVGFYNPRSLISFRLLSREPVAVDEGFLRGRIEEAVAFRRRAGLREESFRACFGESDGLPGLVVDKYGDRLVVQALAAGMERLLPEVRAALEAVFAPKGIYLKNDHPSRVLEGLPTESRVLSGEVPERAAIEEAGLAMSCQLTGGQKTGYYFDQRENRAYLEPFFKGRTVLDLYCYTGSFSLRAARAGAARVLGLDSSGPAVELARENAAANGLAGRCEFDEGDAEEVLAAFAEGRQPIRPDMILLDPPGFASSRKHLPQALRAYTRLNAAAIKVLPKGGLLATSTCSHHVSREDFARMVASAAGKAGRQARLLALRGQAVDHPVLLSMPETEYLHFALVEVG